MIIILNGSLGIGKTSVAWALQEFVSPSFMLDGDYIGAVKPFEIYDEKRVDYLYQTIIHLIEFHIKNGYQHFIINYVFETQAILDSLKESLQDFDQEIFTFRLTCSEQEHQERIQRRNSDQLDWELNRSRELNQILSQNSRDGDLGTEIDTSARSAKQVAEIIWKQI